MSDMAEGIAKHTEQNIFGAADPSREVAKNARRIVVKVRRISQEPEQQATVWQCRVWHWHQLPRCVRPVQVVVRCGRATVLCTSQQSLQPPQGYRSDPQGAHCQQAGLDK